MRFMDEPEHSMKQKAVENIGKNLHARQSDDQVNDKIYSTHYDNFKL